MRKNQNPNESHVPNLTLQKSKCGIKVEMDLIRDRLNWTKELAQKENENE